MNDSQREGTSYENVVENWEEAGDEVSAQLEQREKVILKRKQKEEEMARIREEEITLEQFNLEQQQSLLPLVDKITNIKILKRPQSCDKLHSSSQSDCQQSEQLLQKSLEERQAAYLEARERIFGDKYNPDENPDPDDNNCPSDSQTNISVYPRNPPPIPRPRLSIAGMSVPSHFRPVIPNVPFAVPPHIGVFQPIAHRQAMPLQQNVVGVKPQQVMYDSRIPIPNASIFPPMNLAAATRPNNQPQRNPVPYGRPPVQLLSQYQLLPRFDPPDYT